MPHNKPSVRFSFVAHEVVCLKLLSFYFDQANVSGTTHKPVILVGLRLSWIVFFYVSLPSIDDNTSTLAVMYLMITAEIACGTPGFESLCTNVVATGLAGALSTGTWTVFAPTNEAFADFVLRPKGKYMDSLTNLILYHAVPNATVLSSQLVCDASVTMADGSTTTTVCQDGSFFQKGTGNAATDLPLITTADITASNGVIHVVDAVIYK